MRRSQFALQITPNDEEINMLQIDPKRGGPRHSEGVSDTPLSFRLGTSSQSSA